jgi:hypothetical protein
MHCLAAGLVLAAAGGGLCAAFGWQKPDHLWRAYLLGLLTWWPLAVGGIGLVALGNLTGGRWAAAGRPFYLAAGTTLPVLVILFVPLAFALEQIYPWARTGADSAAEFSASKAAYLSTPFFLARAVGYLLVWLAAGAWLRGVSRLDRPPASRPAMRRAGAISLVLLVPTVTFAAFDWAMSLEPHWYSSIYGAIITAGGVVAVHSMALVGLAGTTPAMRAALFITRPHGAESDDGQAAELFNDLGNLLLAFIMVWTYFSFSQFFLIWSANLPSEIVWYQRRLAGGWGVAALVIVLTCFAAPFLMLLSRDLKRTPRPLAGIASLLLAGYALNMYWTIVPAFPPGNLADHLANMAAVVGVGGLCLALYSWNFSRLSGARPRRRDSAA